MTQLARASGRSISSEPLPYLIAEIHALKLCFAHSMTVICWSEMPMTTPRIAASKLEIFIFCSMPALTLLSRRSRHIGIASAEITSCVNPNPIRIARRGNPAVLCFFSFSFDHFTTSASTLFTTATSTLPGDGLPRERYRVVTTVNVVDRECLKSLFLYEGAHFIGENSTTNRSNCVHASSATGSTALKAKSNQYTASRVA